MTIYRFYCQLIWCLISCALLILNFQSFASEYEVDGEIEQTIYEMDGHVGVERKSHFTVFVKGCSWLVQTVESDAKGNPTIVRETACTSGKEIYEVTGRLNKQTHHGVKDWNMATIVSNNVPVGENEGYYVSHLWLMFASGCYFEQLATNRLTPVYDVNASVPVDPNLKREAKWDLISGSGSLPSSVTYLNEGSVVDATYTATGTTNAGAIQIPSGFVFERRIGFRFAPGPTAPGESVPAYRICKRAVATVTAVRPYCSRRDLSPTAEGMTMVIGERSSNYLAQPNNLPTYIVKSGVQWLPLAKAQQSYVAQRASPKPFSRGLIVIMLALPSAVFLLLWGLSRKKK